MKKLLLSVLLFVFFGSNAVVLRNNKSTGADFTLHTFLQYLNKNGKKVLPQNKKKLIALLNRFSSKDQMTLSAIMLNKHQESNSLHTCWRCELLEKVLQEKKKRTKDRALLWIIENTHKEDWAKVCEILIEFGANANTKNKDDIPLIYLAIKKNRPKVLDMLIECGAKLNVCNPFFATPLIYSLLKLCNNEDYLGVVNVILDQINNLSFDEKDLAINRFVEDFYPSFFYAIQSQDVNIVQRLLDMGVRLDRLNINEKSPCEYACEFKNEEIREIIWQALHDQNYCI